MGKAGGKVTIFDIKGKVLLPPRYDSLMSIERDFEPISFQYGYAAVLKGNKWGFIDSTFKEIIAPQYDRVDNFDTSGNVDIPLIARVQSSGKWGLIDITGKEIITCKYNAVSENFEHGYLKVKLGADSDGRGGQWGLIDAAGKQVLPHQYDALNWIIIKNIPILIVMSAGKYGILQSNLQKGILPMYEECFNYHEYGILVKKENTSLWTLLDDNLNTVAQYECSRIQNGGFGDFKYGRLQGRQTWMFGIIDSTGKVIVPIRDYASIYYFSSQYAAAQRAQSKKWGFINRIGKEVIPAVYDNVRNFSGNYAVVKGESKEVYDTYTGRAKGKNEATWGVIDKTGDEVVSLKYNDIQYDTSKSNDLFAIKIDDKWGVLGRNFEEIISPKYPSLEILSSSCIKVKIGEQYGIVDTTGKGTIPPMYDNIESYFLNQWFGQN